MVKVEGAMVERIKAICDSGIMVMSHLGLTPHTRAKLGGYRVQGKTADQAEIVLKQALALKRYCEAGQLIKSSLEQYRDEVRGGVFPSAENFYEIKDEELEKLLGDTKWKYEADRVENKAEPKHSVTPRTSKGDQQ